MIDSKQIKPGNSGQKLKTINGATVWAEDGIPFLNTGQSVSYQTVGHDDTYLTISNSPADTQIGVTVNGIVYRVGNSIRTKDCYFASEHPFNRIAGGNATMAALKNQYAWTWGPGTNGVLGDNTTASKSSPVSVVGAHNFVVFGQTSADGNQMAALKGDGSAWTWGDNSAGQLGDSSATSRSSPVSVVGTHSFISIATGLAALIALKADGSTWTWGTGTSGRLGDNTATSKSSPVSVVGAHVFVQIASGANNNYSLKSDGTIWAWGAGTNGALGDNQVAANRSSPVSVVGAHSFVLISAGGTLVGTLKSSGTAWTWGDPASGGIGDNQVAAARSSPVSVVGAHSFAQISTGTNFQVAMKADGSAWSWGLGTSGQLGDNTATSKSSPVSVVGTHSFIAIKAGTTSAMGLKNDGSIWSWGSNTNGRLGDNTTTAQSSPVSVVGHPANIARAISDIAVNDVFIWNGPAAGIDLKTTDNIDFNYST